MKISENSQIRPAINDKGVLIAAASMMGLVAAGLVALFIFTSEQGNPFRDMYLMPWVVATGIAVSAPSAYLYYKGRFEFFHPLVFAAWIYFFPAFVIGGLILASGLSEPYFLAFVDNPRYNLPLTLIYAMLGYLGLTAGFFLPLGGTVGRKIEKYLPEWKWESSRLLIPGLILFVLGIINTIVGFVVGLLGYQRVEEIGAYDGIIFLLTLFWLQASCLLWLSIFRAKQLTVNHYFIAGILVITALLKAAFQGNRGSLLQIFILVAFAFVFSGRKVLPHHRIYAVIVVSVSLIAGVVYGTTFRNIKESEARVSMATYSENILETFDRIGEQDLGVTLSNGFSALAERIEAISSLAVVVANYEELRPYEESYGLDNNIYKDTLTFFIPRVIWADKPLASEPRRYSDLYFNYSENSFTITPMGDLLRNFGPVGVPLGMILLGILIRVIYSMLIENQVFSYWRALLYYMLLTSISYESFYASILPYLIKVGVVAVLGILILRFLVGGSRRTV